jgi:hypothetical protein
MENVSGKRGRRCGTYFQVFLSKQLRVQRKLEREHRGKRETEWARNKITSVKERNNQTLPGQERGGLPMFSVVASELAADWLSQAWCSPLLCQWHCGSCLIEVLQSGGHQESCQTPTEGRRERGGVNFYTLIHLQQAGISTLASLHAISILSLNILNYTYIITQFHLHNTALKLK